MNEFSVRIVGASEERKPTRYQVVVRDVDAVSGHVSMWTVWKRYSDLRALRDAVRIVWEREAGGKEAAVAVEKRLPSFPPKRLLGSGTDRTVRARLVGLDAYFAAVAATPELAGIGLLRWALQPPLVVAALVTSGREVGVPESPEAMVFDASLASFDNSLRVLSSLGVPPPWEWLKADRQTILSTTELDSLQDLAAIIPSSTRRDAAVDQLGSRRPLLDDMGGLVTQTPSLASVWIRPGKGSSTPYWGRWMQATSLRAIGVEAYLDLRIGAEVGGSLGDPVPRATWDMMRADVPRTYPDTPWVHSDRVETALVRVVGAWVYAHPQPGYHQGMLGLVVPLLWVHLHASCTPDDPVFTSSSAFPGNGEWASTTTGAVSPEDLTEANEAELYTVFDALMEPLTHVTFAGPDGDGGTHGVRMLLMRIASGLDAVTLLDDVDIDLAFILPKWFRTMFFDALPPSHVWPMIDAVMTHPGSPSAYLESLAAITLLSSFRCGVWDDVSSMLSGMQVVKDFRSLFSTALTSATLTEEGVGVDGYLADGASALLAL